MQGIAEAVALGREFGYGDLAERLGAISIERAGPWVMGWVPFCPVMAGGARTSRGDAARGPPPPLRRAPRGRMKAYLMALV